MTIAKLHRLVWPALFALAGCAAERLERHEYSEAHMGTQFRIVLYARDAPSADRAARAAFERIAGLDAELSDYDENSATSRLSAQSDLRAPTDAIAVGDDLWRVLERSLEVSRESDGAFDASVGPVVALWRRARRQHELPDAQRLAAAAESVGWRNIELDPAARTVRLLAPRMRLDFGGIAKGFASDEALRVMRELGVERALVDGGGGMSVGRAPPDCTGWKIALVPFADDVEELDIELANAGVATSGDQSQALEVGGVRYSHIIDPRTGQALTRRTAASVIAPDGMTADALATALCVLGPDAGLALIAATPGTHARITTLESGGFKSCESPGLRALMLRAGAHPAQSSSSPPRASPKP
jgi:thiamine biosynthesis lipoprotein